MTKLNFLFFAIFDELCVLFRIDQLFLKKNYGRSSSFRYGSGEKANIMTKQTSGGYESQPFPKSEISSKRNWCQTIDEKRLALEIFTLAVALGYGIIYYGQLRANWHQADAAEKQLTEMQRQMQLDERAWISIDGPRLMTPYSAEHIGIQVSVKNTGKTPGYIEGIDVSVMEIFQGRTNTVNLYEKHLGGLTCGPGGSYPLRINQPLDIGENLFSVLTNCEMEVCFSIKIRYRDVFNLVRHTDDSLMVTGPATSYEAGQVFPSCGDGHMD